MSSFCKVSLGSGFPRRRERKTLPSPWTLFQALQSPSASDPQPASQQRAALGRLTGTVASSAAETPGLGSESVLKYGTHRPQTLTSPATVVSLCAKTGVHPEVFGAKLVQMKERLFTRCPPTIREAASSPMWQKDPLPGGGCPALLHSDA